MAFKEFIAAVASYAEVAETKVVVDYLERGLRVEKANGDLDMLTLEVTSENRKALEQQVAEGGK